jgi:hypothetical protein
MDGLPLCAAQAAKPWHFDAVTGRPSTSSNSAPFKPSRSTLSGPAGRHRALTTGREGALAGQSKIGVEGAAVENAGSGHNVIARVDDELVGKTIDYGFVQSHLDLGELFNKRVCWRIGIQQPISLTGTENRQFLLEDAQLQQDGSLIPIDVFGAYLAAFMGNHERASSWCDPWREPVHLNCVCEPENELVDDSILRDTPSQKLEFSIGWYLRNEDFPVELAQCFPPGSAGSDGYMDQDGMAGHCRDRLVCVLMLKLGGGVRFPYIDQSLVGRIETLHSICPFRLSYRAFPGCGLLKFNI